MSALHPWLSVAALGCLLATGCVQQAATIGPAEALAMLRTGQPLLGCREACLAEWRRVEPQAEQLVQVRRWQELASLLLRVQYEDDLSLYFLGQAAEGLGYRQAAARYYRQSVELSRTPAACRRLSRLCGGLNLPAAASLRVAAIERALMPRRRPQTEPAMPPEVAPGQPASANEMTPAAAAPAATPASPLPPPPPPGSQAPPISDYIEPPPLVR